MNILKEIEVKDSFLELDSDVIKCQSYESNGTYDSCTTRFFSEQMKSNCGFLPYAIRNAVKKTNLDISKCFIYEAIM